MKNGLIFGFLTLSMMTLQATTDDSDVPRLSSSRIDQLEGTDIFAIPLDESAATDERLMEKMDRKQAQYLREQEAEKNNAR